MKKQEVSISAMAKKLGLSLNGICNTFKKTSIQIDRLVQISEILQVIRLLGGNKE
ncbi:hypothetical protein [Labilibaculum manganireducens]|uniref:hypothetical protein n=1 Tax=Labilibaculum manganireducens TaxID=1940525 RepID=UPI0015D5C6F9|nr:hypothetical protein [Labilibaculum manganireducens]